MRARSKGGPAGKPGLRPPSVARRRAQDAVHLAELHRLLYEGRERLAEIYDFAPVALVTLDHAGIIREANLAAAQLLRRERTALLGLALTGSVARGDREVIRRQLSHCRRDPAATPVADVKLAPPDGGIIPVRVITRQAVSDVRQAFLAAILDMSAAEELREGHDRLAASERAAAEASQAKDLFIAVLSHELRAPLGAILAATSTIDYHEVPAEVRRAALLIRRNVQAQTRLIDDLLDLTRITRGIATLQRAPNDVHAIADDAVETVAHELNAKAITVIKEYGASAHVVDGDGARLRQVFLNLLKNAAKFTPAGGEIALRSWNNGRRVVLEVSDTGVGFDPAVAERLFAPYQQVVKGAGGGVGLGLAIAKGIVDLHGGVIAASSRGPGQGARFVVELQTTFAPSAVVEAPPMLVPVPPPPARRQHGRRPRRILLVEDNPDFAESLTLALRAAGYEVETAASCQAARTTDLRTIDLVVSDLQLPDGEGLDLIQELHEKAAVNAIALSGYATDRDVEASKKAGFSAHFSKPVDVKELLGAIDHATQHRIPLRHRGAHRGGRA
jgi:PAS domain S-box-containing protein